MKKSNNRGTKIIIIGIIAAISILGYVAHSHYYFETGFPLDDAWIHQTYARNLVLYGEWSFIPGMISAGSTSPLWTILLTPAYLFGISPLAWSYFIGWIILWLAGIVSSTLFEKYCPQHKRYSLWVGGCMVLEWHLIWAAVSGMETLLLGLLFLTAFLDIKIKHYHWVLRGLLIGISVWVRPDGILLLLPSLVYIVLYPKNNKIRLLAFAYCMIGFIVFFLPYLGFNYHLTGDWWPNTFYAKQTEYAIMRETSLITRYLKEFAVMLVGAGILLFPGFILYLIFTVKTKKWELIAPVLLILGYIGSYALRLPVTYQHGRYIIPVMPLYFILGVSGLALYSKASQNKLLFRVLYRACLLSSVFVLVMFWCLGARSYAKDVGFIQSEMVAMANWVKNNTDADALIAAHDIGALGFFGDRDIIDLAGLISPEVIPFIRDEYKIEEYLNDQQVDYLVTFPDWYPYLSSKSEKIYQSNSNISIELGGENMAIFRWINRP